MDMNDLWKKFEAHRRRAENSGIGFELTFEQWLGKWVESGKLAERGCHKGEYVMSRRGDTGPYAIGNVFIQSAEGNVSDAQKGKLKGPQTEEHIKKIRDYRTGKSHSADTRKKIRDTIKNKPKKECPHCHISCSAGNFSRWHGDQCKRKGIGK